MDDLFWGPKYLFFQKTVNGYDFGNRSRPETLQNKGVLVTVQQQTGENPSWKVTVHGLGGTGFASARMSEAIRKVFSCFCVCYAAVW